MNSQANQNKKASWKAIQKLLSSYRKGKPLQPVEGTNNLHLSFEQERLWFLNQLGGDNTVYNFPFAFWLNGSLNVIALEKSLNEIIKRHEILRSTYPCINSQPIQIITHNIDWKLLIVDLQQNSEAEQKNQVEQIIQETINKSFDLAKGPLWQFKLLQLDAEKYVLLMVIHHLIYDGYSHSVFTQELSTLYKDFSEGKTSSLADLPLQYTDFAHWHRQWLQGDILQSQIDYWQQQLAGDIPLLNLPYDQPLSSYKNTYQGKRESIELSPHLSNSLQVLSDNQGVTLYIILLGAFNLLLYQYTQQKDIIISSIQAGRDQLKIQGLIGFFNHILPLRTQLLEISNFAELVNQLNQVVLDAYQYQDLPLQKLAECQNLVQKQLYKVMFAWQNVPNQLLNLPEIEVEADYLDQGKANFDLFLSLEYNEAQNLSGYLEYKTELFSTKIIREILDNYVILLENIVENPELKLANLPFLRDVEENQILVESLLSREKFVAPRQPIEEKLAQIWSEVLHQEKIGIYDNFFQLGGHSLLATQVISRINTAFQAQVPILRIFKYQTIAELTKSIEDYLENNQQENTTEKIQPVLRPNKLPLSFAQQRLWFLDQFGSSIAYNLDLTLAFSGNLNLNALAKALQEIVNRHESLRTTFSTDNGTPYQVICPQVKINLPVIDLSNIDSENLSYQINDLVVTELTKPFNLEKDSMLRGIILSLGDQPVTLPFIDLQNHQPHYILIITLHHIAADGWSLAILKQELITLYSAFSEGKSSPLPKLPIQYADFTIWQRNYLEKDILTKQLDYWKATLKDSPEMIQLPTDFPDPPQENFKGDIVSVEIDANLTKQLVQLSQEQGTTLYITLLTAFQVLMYRYTGQKDIVIASPIANRNLEEIELLIGFFVNTLAMRINLSEIEDKSPSFLKLLSQVKENAHQAYDHQDLPFEKLVEALYTTSLFYRERSISTHPLFNVMFVLHNRNINKQLELNQVQYQNIQIHNGTAKYDLLLQLAETSEGLVGHFEYRTDLFKVNTIKRMVEHLKILLTEIVANPKESISRLSILSPLEKNQLLIQWNNTQINYHQNQCFQDLFEAQVKATPDAVAIVFEHEQLTYHQLNFRANQLAYYLRELGVKPEFLVGLYIERSLLMIIAILGILKPGGAYVPLDPTYPSDRISFMLEDANINLLLTQKNLTKQLPKYQGKIIILEEIEQEIGQKSTENLPKVVKGSNLAYIIYTSGSTGRPKGVMIEQFGLYNLAKFQQSIFNLNSDSRILQFTSLSFDVSIWEIMMALGAGGKLYLGSRYSLLPGINLIERLRQDKITHLNLTPSALAVMPIEELPALETIIVAGEACSSDLVEKWGYKLSLKSDSLKSKVNTSLFLSTSSKTEELQLDSCSQERNFFNAYGPTEITVIATVHKCNPNDQYAPIGRPITNTQTYLLDQELQPVPIGLPGELHIGGVGVARGYLNRPQLTQEKFINNPYGDGKLYKTGDLCKYLEDGSLVFLGRIDHQVKIRGFRIEVGEIETVLRQNPDVQDVVIIDITSENDKRLIAYITPQLTDDKITTLRDYLKQKLPNYMIPSAFVSLQQFPKTPSNKIDRKSLPIIDITPSNVAYVLPSNEIEHQILSIWKQVLNVQNLSIHDNFFEVGGHSLLVIKVHSLLQLDYPNLKVIDLFSYPTIRDLATYLNRNTTNFETTKHENSQARGMKRRASQIARQKRKEKS